MSRRLGTSLAYVLFLLISENLYQQMNNGSDIYIYICGDRGTTAVIAILSSIGLDKSQSQGAVGYRPILSTITEPIEGFPAGR